MICLQNVLVIEPGELKITSEATTVTVLGKGLMANKENDFVRKFIEENHKEYVEGYYRCYYDRYKADDWREQLRILFLDSLGSGEKGNIDQKAKSIKEFEETIKKMEDKTYEELKAAFDAESYSALFKELKKYKQIGNKKAALFLRNILYFDNIIAGVPCPEKKLFYVPVDKVIVRTVNSIFGKDYKPDTEKAFNGINEMAKEIFDDKRPILLEDLWFWGRFYRCPEKRNSYSPCKFNEPLLSIDIFVTEQYRKKLLTFGEEANRQCPFFEICNNPSKKRAVYDKQ